MMIGKIKNEFIENEINELLVKIRDDIFEMKISKTNGILHHIYILINGCITSPQIISKLEIKQYLENMANSYLPIFNDILKSRLEILSNFIYNESKKIYEKYKKSALSLYPIILILDSKLNNFPFESLSILREIKQPICRMPTIKHLSNLFNKLNAVSKNIDPAKGFFILNPSKDLISTQKVFEDYFIEKMKWKGKIGIEPNEQDIFSALQESDLYVYCGHGAGECFYSSEDLRKIEVQSASFLMGCSSSFFSDNGLYENNGILISYLTSGWYF